MSDFKYVEEDYERIRDELYEMLADAKEALAFAKSILEESEHPRAIETYSGLLKNVATIMSQILDLTKTYKDIIEKKDSRALSDETSVTNNNLFVGNTPDLQKKLAAIGIVTNVEAQERELKDV